MTTVSFWRTGNIEGHMELIRRQVEKSLADPGLRQLAVRIVSRTYDYVDTPTGKRPVVLGWDKYFWAPEEPPCPPKDDSCELGDLWSFVVRNCRYVYDPDGTDLFATAKETLLIGGGDCFPEGTLVFRDDGLLVPIETVEVGDRIHDGVDFVPVLKTWNRGPKEIISAALDNNCTLRLTPNHKVLRMPVETVVPKSRGCRDWRVGGHGTEQEVMFGDLRIGDFLLQPREFAGGSQEMTADDALLVAAYITEGFADDRRTSRVTIAGIPNNKGIRERVLAVLERRGIHTRVYDHGLVFRRQDVGVLEQYQQMGRYAADKRLPHLDWTRQTIEALVAVMDATDAGRGGGNNQNVIYASRSRELALQYRILQRMLGRSTALRAVTKHVGPVPLYRVRVRNSHDLKPFVRVLSLAAERDQSNTYDIMTASGRVYLPESDVVTRQCDDAVIVLCSLARAIGFTDTRGRVVSMNGEEYEHTYPVIGCPKDNPKVLVPLDCTVAGAHAGWQVENPAAVADFPMF